ncbi:Unsaturated chondroitin disaccharide hydrolase [Paenibacillus solanacearum]|uniref:Unsaturated chondroitin disaccharide hydrolase n=1 Tax=Paenibacillus solanacearum TaxID=2048548 RepID=A0A916K2H4_9BACL|nr:glycoside hydrolase family 88 protein [Paenibacillus solanacearum]CAG7632773.1 Unsaturated chondroitin disaccharide hydrolase [Paenibacillus solanacearum]
MKAAAYEAWIDEAWEKAVAKIGLMSQAIGSGFPHVSKDGKYDGTEPQAWTSGFWPGLLWLAYRDTKNEAFRQLAEACEAQMDVCIDEYTRLHHDVGFMWSLSSVANYKLTGSAESKLRALKVAAWLASRFNLKGGYIRAWNNNNWKADGGNAGWAIIDCMMNLSLLFWASAEIGDPRFKHIAAEHANTVLREFFREDGSCCHIAAFDPETGQRVGTLGGQGYAPESAWARGTAWALYGLALCYHYTKDDAYLQGSKRSAHFFLANLPEDLVPYWDFRLPTLEGAPRDSSAAAIAASGLLLLAESVPAEQSRLYASAAKRILKSLADHYAVWDQQDEAILLHGTGHYPAGKNIDVGLIYGDYFFVEALAKLRGQRDMFW